MKGWVCRWALLGLLAACGGTADGDGPDPSAGGADGGGAGSGEFGGAGGEAGAAGSLGEPGGTGGGGASVPELAAPVAKIDLLLMVDNSISMSDKQEILQRAVPDIVSRLVNPICVDAAGNEYPPPPSGGSCSAGQTRQFNAITDINLGIVSSSLGDAGADVACPQASAPGYRADRVDMAHLMGSVQRSRVQRDTAEGFLAWRPGTSNLDEFNQDVQQMVRDVGEFGCGWESSLESWYRFLVDPYPYRQLVRVQCPGSTSPGANCVQPATDAGGRMLLDDTLLAQRAAFMRPDSLLVILLLTDENDCSIQVGNQSWVVVAIDDSRPMFRGSAVCAEDANAKCCYSCPLGPPSGCSADPICNGDEANDVLPNRLPAREDGLNLRCFQQKRRFGVDFLYPTQRYVNALSRLELCWNAMDLSTEACAPENIVQNPLFASWDRRARVFLAGVIGVPWQAMASSSDASGRPLSDPTTQLRFKSAAELAAPGDTTWEQILGSPGVSWRAAEGGRAEAAGVPAVPPSLPQMIESEFPRSGIAPGNAINGREYDTAQGLNGGGAPDDLQYACIFPLPEARDCAQRDLLSGDACDCYEGDQDRPLCEQSPGVSPPGTVQYFSKAYPGSRHLAVLKDYGANSIVASICARNVTDSARADFGYRPAAQAVLERLSEAISAAEGGASP